MTLWPVYLPRPRGQESEADHESGIAVSENNLNRNLELLSARIAALEAAVIALRDGK